MDEKFEVTHGGRTVGTVKLRREGLYCRILCRCGLMDGEIYRLYADGEKLGVLVPSGGELVLETKVAAKRLKPGCGFSLDGRQASFFPIRPGEAFPQLCLVREGKLIFRDGEPGLLAQ